MSPIDSLPSELLIEIFVYCSWNDSVAPSNLSLVCSTWKDVVWGSPRAWQLITLDDRSNSIQALQYKITRWIEMAAPMPFDVEIAIRGHNHEMLLPLLSVIVPELGRWRSCYFVRGSRKEEMLLEWRGAEENDYRSPRIDHVEVAVNDMDAGHRGGDSEDEDEEEEDEEEEDEGHSAQQWPSLERHHTGAVVLHFSLSFLPPPDLIRFMGLASLSISETAIDITQTSDPVSMLNFLMAFPNLQSFSFNGLPHEVDTGDAIPPVVSLPYLERLVLRSTCGVRMILSQIDAPKLHTLQLEHLNMEFAFNHLPPEEDGDSEDEANDFSQSPASDRALGMGLRRLHKRSCPPIQTLTLSYADLRTKDFIYCFQHFPLRKLDLVGSDMSDKVMRLFKPYVDYEGVKRLRLPELVHLELYYCHRLSGDAVVDALCERVRFGDAKSTRGLGLPMESVAVVGCSDIMHEHVLALSRVLKSRFQASGMWLIC